MHQPPSTKHQLPTTNYQLPSWWIRLWIGVLIAGAILASTLAQELPLVSKTAEGAWVYPAWRTNWAAWGWTQLPTVESLAAEKPFLHAFIPYGPTTQDKQAVLTKPTSRHWFGTDGVGRDVATLIIYGARSAIFIGLGALFFALLIGLPLGLVAGFFGDRGLKKTWWQWLVIGLGLLVGLWAIWAAIQLQNVTGSLPWLALLICAVYLVNKLTSSKTVKASHLAAFPVESTVLRFFEWWQALPKMLLLLVLVTVIEQPSHLIMAACIGVLEWPFIARLTRAQTAEWAKKDFVRAGQALGLSSIRLTVRHIWPNIFGPLAVASVFVVADAILLEAGLALLGLGLPPEVPTWGGLLMQARHLPGYWHLWLFVSLILLATIASLQQLGYYLQQRYAGSKE
jgi:peptide/nickel transport system permease protein